MLDRVIKAIGSARKAILYSRKLSSRKSDEYHERVDGYIRHLDGVLSIYSQASVFQCCLCPSAFTFSCFNKIYWVGSNFIFVIQWPVCYSVEASLRARFFFWHSAESINSVTEIKNMLEWFEKSVQRHWGGYFQFVMLLYMLSQVLLCGNSFFYSTTSDNFTGRNPYLFGTIWETIKKEGYPTLQPNVPGTIPRQKHNIDLRKRTRRYRTSSIEQVWFHEKS